ncbi:MAG TPA: hypothetical protein VL463_06820 [Kofleriaceae bacterium]|nr:hypothetical protein [Kofleriaceae bacterium]
MRSAVPLLLIVAACGSKASPAADAAAPDAAADAAPDARPPDASPADAGADAGGVDASELLDCAQPITCPQPAAGKMTVCGQLADLEMSLPIEAAQPKGLCDPGSPTADGPCALAVHPYDAIAFAQDPKGATELPNGGVTVDECGRFRIADITPMNAAAIGLAVDNATGVDTYRLSGSVIPLALGKTVTDVPLFAITKTLDTKWTAAAGLTGATFVDRGVYVGIFVHAGDPVASVKVTRSGATDAANDYYFSDPAPGTRTTIDPAQASTGANGTALMIGTPDSLVLYSGTGGETTDCKWPSDVGDQIPGAAFVQPRLEVTKANPSTLCP